LPKTKQRLNDDEALLLAEIHQLDEAILRLTERKARALIQLNDIRTPYKNFPDEVLSAIFEHAEQISRPPFDMTSHLEPRTETYQYLTPLDHYFPIHVLGAVCSRWRQIAWSTRGLWSFLNLNVGDVINNKHGLMLPRYYFENVGMRQMTLIVDCTTVQESDSSFEPLQSSRTRDKEVSMKSLRDLIFRVYPQKIAQLRLISPPPEWLPLLSNLFVSLKGMELSWPLENGRCSKTIVRPQIHFGRSIELSWVQMTHLQLQDIGFQLASQLLISCPNLISYSVWSVTSGNPAGVPNNQVILPHLETFRWTWTSCDAHAKLLRLLRMPSLQYLYWTEQKLLGSDDLEYEKHCPAIGFFFSKLPAHQLQLYLCQFGFFEQYRVMRRFRVILSSTPRLRYLGIHEPLHQPFASRTDPLRAVATIIEKARLSNIRALSELERVSLTGWACLSVVQSGSVIMLLDERRLSGMTTFRLDVPGFCRMEFWWNNAIRRIFRDMVDEGLELKIFAGGKTVLF